MMVLVPYVADCGLAYLSQIKPADLACHPHGDAHVRGHKHVRERRRQQHGFFHTAVVIIAEINGILFDILKQLGADGRQLGLGIPGCRVCHIPGIGFAEVALGIHKGGKQRLVPFGKAHHGFIYRRVPVGVKPHGLPHNVGGFCPPPRQQPHLEHGIQQLAMGRFKAVYLRYRPGHDHAHGIGHIVDFKCLRDGLLQNLRLQPNNVFIGVF